MSRELKTELMRQARLHVKSEIRAAGNRIGDYKAREISELAEQWLDINPQFIDEVREEMAKAATAAPKYKSIPSLAPNPEKVKANEEKKKEQGRKLAAAKAGKTPVTKAKPGTATNEQVTAMLAMKAKASGLSKPLN
jgi:hypothetical protein